MNKHYAIKVLKDLRIFDDDCDEDCEALNMAIEALEKQIPKKVTLVFKNDYDLVYCPRCGVKFIQYGLHFCGECGQALDWSERNG